MAESDTPASSTSMRKRACERPDPRLSDASTWRSPYAPERSRPASLPRVLNRAMSGVHAECVKAAAT